MNGDVRDSWFRILFGAAPGALKPQPLKTSENWRGCLWDSGLPVSYLAVQL
jgi:hypothetical protein